ncbi:MAG TPA: phage major capsid protein [Acidimicrobiia bacterium]
MNRKDAARILKQMREEALELGYDGKATDGEALDSFLTELNVEFKHAGKAVSAKAMLQVIGGTLEVEPMEEAPEVEGNEMDEDEEAKMEDEDENAGKARGKSVRKAIATNHTFNGKAGRVDRSKSLYNRKAQRGEAGFTDADSACEFAAWARTQALTYARSKDAARIKSAYTESGQFRKDLEVLGVKNAETVDPTLGGSLIREALDQNVIVIKNEFGVARQLADVIVADEKVYRYTLDGLDNTASWTGEGVAIADSDAKFEPQALIANKLAAFDRATIEIFTQPGVDIADKIARKMLRSINKKEDLAYIDGNGEATNGGFIGLKNRLRNLDATAANIDGLHVQGTGNTFAAVVLGDLHSVMGKVTKGNPANYKWLVSNRFYFDVMVRLTAALGGTTRQMVEGGPQLQFEGYEVVIDNSGAMPTSSSASNVITALFGDFETSSRMLEVRNSVRFDTSEDFLFDSDEVAMKYREEVAFNIHGQGTASEAGSYAGLITG